MTVLSYLESLNILHSGRPSIGDAGVEKGRSYRHPEGFGRHSRAGSLCAGGHHPECSEQEHQESLRVTRQGQDQPDIQ